MDIIKKIKNYTINQRHCLGEGSFGKVYEGTSDEGRKVAIKKIDQKIIVGDRYLRESLDNEILIMQSLKHPNIVQLYQVIYTANNIYLVMEYCSGGDLKRYCSTRKITQEKAFDILRQIVRGFQEMSKLGIIHRDLKPANILVHQDNFKICDFGFAKFFGEAGKMARTCVGTPIYMSPQVLKQKQYTSKTDIWSMGVLFYQLLFGKLPYSGYSEQDLYRNIMKGPLNYPDCSKQALKILQGTLVVEQGSRWGWSQLIQVLFGKNVPNLQGRAQTPKQQFYKVNSNNDNIQQQQKKLDKRVYDRNIPAMNNNYFIDDHDQSPTDRVRQQGRKQQPTRNIFALQNGDIIQNILPINQPNAQLAYTPTIPIVNNQNDVEQNPRFVYFVLIELVVNPINSSSYDSFIFNLCGYVIDLYDRLLKKQGSNPSTMLYRRVLESELNQVRILKNQVNQMKEGNLRNIGDILYRQAKQNPQNKRKIVWLRRFLDRKYSYQPID